MDDGFNCVRKSAGGGGGKTLRYILVAINVFDRYLYAEPMQTKEPPEVKFALEKLLSLALKKPKLISSDQGLEFRGW